MVQNIVDNSNVYAFSRLEHEQNQRIALIVAGPEGTGSSLTGQSALVCTAYVFVQKYTLCRPPFWPVDHQLNHDPYAEAR